jgi:hypothetical protein
MEMRREPAAQPAVPADRFARKIVRILAVCVMRLRQLNGNPLGGVLSKQCQPDTHAKLV